MKHKGGSIPKDWLQIYHKSNPIFRDKIEVEGLLPMKGDSYMLHSPEDTEPAAIFGYYGDMEYYDSTYDDDIWLIDLTKVNNEFFIDNEVGEYAVVTYVGIPREAILLIYKGTGKSL